jgi:hypothetical protein
MKGGGMTGRNKSRRTRRVRRVSSRNWNGKPNESKKDESTDSIKDEILSSDWQNELRERLSAVSAEFFE